MTGVEVFLIGFGGGLAGGATLVGSLALIVRRQLRRSPLAAMFAPPAPKLVKSTREPAA